MFTKCLLLLLLFVCCCMPVAPAQPAVAVAQEQVAKDPRLEVIDVLHLLSKRRCESTVEETYRRNVLEKFGKYRNHTAVLYWRAIQDKYDLYPYEVSVNLLFENDRFIINRQDQNSFLNEVNERERQEFIRLLNDFSHRSGFISDYHRVATNQ